MRKTLFTAAAVAPLALLAALPAMADTTVGSTSSPVDTATANGGQPDNVVVNSGATVSTNGPASVTLNSNNTVTNNGSITINANVNNNNTAAVLLNGGYANGALTNTGTISNTDNYTPPTNNTNGYADGAFAQGSGRYGVRLVGPGALGGSINLQSASSITVQGNNSYGVSLEAPVGGDVIQAGTITLTGDNGMGFAETGGVGGKLQIAGTISSTGTGSGAVNVTGDVTGPMSIYAAMTATGYRNTTRNVDPTLNGSLTAAQVTQAGPAVAIGANLKGGFFLGAPVAGTVGGDATTDADHDGIVDTAEGSGSISLFGQAPALVIGSASKAVEVGISPFGVTPNTYGMILEGGVSGNGVYDTYNATAIQIGGMGAPVAIDGGISVTDTSTITAQSYQANSVTIHLGSGASTPLLNNAGTISALSTETNAKSPFSTTALQIDSGASLGVLNNTGVINSTLTGDNGSAYAVVDQSGALASVTNMGTITAAITPASSTDKVTGSQVALDLSSNTSGVTLVQKANPNPVSNPSSPTTSSGAAITFATTTSPANPSITGDIRLGNGPNNIQFLAGTVSGALQTGSGNSSLLIDNGASYTGALLAGAGPNGQVVTPGVLSVNVNNGSLTDTSTSQVNAGTLNVGASGQLIFAVDPANDAATRFNVSGAANFSNGAQLGVKMLSLLGTQPNYSFTVVNASSLTVGSSVGLTAQTPYLFVASFQPDTANGTMSLNLRRRTAAEADVNAAEARAWNPVYDNLGLNSGIERAFLSQTTAAGYRSMLDQLMPDYAGGAFRGLSWIDEQQGVAAGDPPLGEEQQGPTRAWTQEIVLDESKRTTAQSAGYNMLGIGAVAGLESVSPRGNALGARIGFATVNVRNPDLPGDNMLGMSQIDAGVYWRGKLVGGLQADAQLGAGFIWANDRREFLYSDSQGVVHNVAYGNWAGYTMSGRFGLQYRANLGSFYVEPKAHVDYFRMHQAGYSENGGGAGYDLKVDPRTGDLVSVTGSVLAGMTFGNTGFRWAPQIEIGYRDVLSGNAGTTTALFMGGTNDPMSLLAQPITGGEGIARIGLRMYTDYVDVLLDGGALISANYTDLDVHLTARTVF